MQTRLSGAAIACGLATLLALGGCGDSSSDSAARSAVTNEAATGPAQNPMPRDQAAVRAQVQRGGSPELARGGT